jgi:hypothetical protein
MTGLKTFLTKRLGFCVSPGRVNRVCPPLIVGIGCFESQEYSPNKSSVAQETGYCFAGSELTRRLNVSIQTGLFPLV